MASGAKEWRRELGLDELRILGDRIAVQSVVNNVVRSPQVRHHVVRVTHLIFRVQNALSIITLTLRSVRGNLLVVISMKWLRQSMQPKKDETQPWKIDHFGFKTELVFRWSVSSSYSLISNDCSLPVLPSVVSSGRRNRLWSYRYRYALSKHGRWSTVHKCSLEWLGLILDNVDMTSWPGRGWRRLSGIEEG